MAIINNPLTMPFSKGFSSVGVASSLAQTINEYRVQSGVTPSDAIKRFTEEGSMGRVEYGGGVTFDKTIDILTRRKGTDFAAFRRGDVNIEFGSFEPAFFQSHLFVDTWHQISLSKWVNLQSDVVNGANVLANLMSAVDELIFASWIKYYKEDKIELIKDWIKNDAKPTQIRKIDLYDTSSLSMSSVEFTSAFVANSLKLKAEIASVYKDMRDVDSADYVDFTTYTDPNDGTKTKPPRVNITEKDSMTFIGNSKYYQIETLGDSQIYHYNIVPTDKGGVEIDIAPKVFDNSMADLVNPVQDEIIGLFYQTGKFATINLMEIAESNRMVSAGGKQNIHFTVVNGMAVIPQYLGVVFVANIIPYAPPASQSLGVDEAHFDETVQKLAADEDFVKTFQDAVKNKKNKK